MTTDYGTIRLWAQLSRAIVKEKRTQRNDSLSPLWQTFCELFDSGRAARFDFVRLHEIFHLAVQLQLVVARRVVSWNEAAEMNDSKDRRGKSAGTSRSNLAAR